MAHLRGLVPLVVGMSLVVAGQPARQAQPDGLDGTVHRGTCNRLTDSVSDAIPFLFGIGEFLGNSQAIPAASSFDTIPIPLDALLSDDHAVTASDSAGNVVACGEISGTRTDEGALIVGLKAENNSAITGVAYLSPSDDPSLTEVTLMVAGEPLGEMATAQAKAAASYANDLVRITQSTRESLRAFVTLMGDPRFGQDDWINEVTAQLAIWDSNYEDALTLNPPPVFAETQTLLLEALRLFAEAGDDIALGLDRSDPTMINQATSKVAQASEPFAQVLELVDRIH